MGSQLINANAADRLVGALCSTLMHSLWQGILLAALAGVIIICTRKATSALRYNLLIGALVAFAIGVGATFAWQYGSVRPVSTAITGPMPHFNGNAKKAHMPLIHLPQTNTPQLHVFVRGQALSQPRFPERMNNFLSEHHNAIVFVWFLIVCARSLQLGFGLYGTCRLRRVRVMKVTDDWQKRLQMLAYRLGIKQAVTLLESGIARVPMVIGHLKPVILVPVGLLTALSAEEVEAILIHELAHIKRRDYLVNMLQSLMEIVFFFNPAVLWVSKLIKIERENCCDDLAVAQNNNKINYIRALVSCEEYQASVPTYAMGLTGRKNTLLNRVKRMVSNKNYSLNLFEKTVLAICLVVLGLGVSAFTAREEIKKAVNKVVAAIQHKVVEKDKDKEKVTLTAKDTLKKKQAAPANDVNAVLNSLQQHQHDTLKTTGSAELDALVHKVDSLKGMGSLGSLANPDTSQVKKLMAKLQPRFKAFHDVGMELYHERLVTDTSHMNITLNERELIVNGVRLPENVHDRIYRKYGKEFGDENYSSNYTGGNTGSGRSYINYNAVYPNDVEKQPNGQDNINFQGGDQKTRGIISDMMKDGIITSTDDLSFKIGTTEFVVNYKKQPETVYQKYRAKYVPGRPKGDWIWFYHFDTKKWEDMTGSKNSSDFDGSATGVFQGKEKANSGYNKNGYYNGTPEDYAANASKYPGMSEAQKKYWAGQQRKIIDQMQREGLITNRKDLSFTLTDKTFVINGIDQSGEVFQRYHQEYAPADGSDNWVWNYVSTPGDYSANANGYRNSGASYQLNAQERQRIEAERDKKLVADLLQDGLITDPNNVTFTLTGKKLEINGKKQSGELYKKYKDKYVPDNTGDWGWTYSHHE